MHINTRPDIRSSNCANSRSSSLFNALETVNQQLHVTELTVEDQSQRVESSDGSSHVWKQAIELATHGNYILPAVVDFRLVAFCIGQFVHHFLMGVDNQGTQITP